MMQLITEITFTGVKVDIHTYVKLFSSLYFDHGLKLDKKMFLNYMRSLCSIDHPYETYEYGTELF